MIEPHMPTAADNDDSPGDALPLDELETIEDLDDLSESQWRALVARNFMNGADRMDGMEASIADNTAMTRATWDNTAEIREVVLMGRAFFSAMGKIARGCARAWLVLKPVNQACTVIAGGYMAVRGAIYMAVHGTPPQK
jgi:hypothetical protein